MSVALANIDRVRSLKEGPRPVRRPRKGRTMQDKLKSSDASNSISGRKNFQLKWYTAHTLVLSSCNMGCIALIAIL